MTELGLTPEQLATAFTEALVGHNAAAIVLEPREFRLHDSSPVPALTMRQGDSSITIAEDGALLDSEEQKHRLAAAAEAAGWPAVADDIRDGVPLETVVSRARDVLDDEDVDELLHVLATNEKMQLQVVVGTAFTTSTAATLDVYFQGAPDNGSAQPGTWQVFQATGPLTAAQLTAGQIIARMDWPPSFPANEAPRFVRLLGVVPSGTDFTAGTISYAIIVPARDDTGQKYAQRNYTAPSVV